MEQKSLENHTVTIRDRARIEISGVEAVESFDEESIVLRLAVGRLIIEGSGLHIGELSLGNRVVTADGEILSLLYTGKDERSRGGLFRKK